MNRDEWNEYVQAEPITPNQRGAVMREFARLGVGDRDERLAVCAILLGLDGLGTTADLSMGDAGRLLNVLQHTAGRAELPEVASGDQRGGQAGEQPARPVTWPGLIARIVTQAWPWLARPVPADKAREITDDRG